MLMLSDRFDSGLRRRVEQLCEALAAWVVRDADVAAGDSHQRESQTSNDVTRVQDSPDLAYATRRETWSPASLGSPASSGVQNDARDAWFADSHRLAIDLGHGVAIYDTGDHVIGGVSQQQGARGTVTFVGQHGTVDVERLPRVERPARPIVEPAAEREADPFVVLEKLAALHARGILDDAEFAAMKVELPARI